MQIRIRDATVHFIEHGDGPVLIALHGAGVDHREVEAAVEAVIAETGYRRVYPDLPGMGRSTADGLASNADVVTLLGEFVDQLAAGPALVLGHSYGAYLARGVAVRRPDAVRGLALFCPVGGSIGDVPAHVVVRQDADAYDDLEPGQRDGFDEYFVVRTAATARRYRDHVLPGTRLADETALGRIFSAWSVDTGSDEIAVPTLIAAGRQDSTAGYRSAIELLDGYPRATLAVVDGAGHALMHERPDVLAALLHDWLARAGPRR